MRQKKKLQRNRQMTRFFLAMAIFAVLLTETGAMARPRAIAPEDETTEIRLEYQGRYWVTGYDTCEDCTGKTDGITASGTVATVGRTAAAWPGMEFGTRLWIPGLGDRVIEDRGGLASNVIDVLCEDHDQCFAITGWYDVYAVKEVK